MKILLVFAFVMLQHLCMAQNNYFNITWHHGYESLPSYTPPRDSEKNDLPSVQDAFKYILDSTDIEFRYSYAGCEKRAHAISLLLNERKIKHYKIWNFDPSLISLFYKQNKPTVPNLTKLSEKVSWTYHVAILVYVKKNNATDTLVIDPSIGEKLLSYKEWLRIQSPDHSFYTFLNPEWFVFKTLDQVHTYVGEPIPKKLPGLMTGDFFINDRTSLDSLWIEEALAVNKVGMRIIEKRIYDMADSTKKSAYIQMVTSIESLTKALKGELPDNMKEYKDELVSYQKEFLAEKEVWRKRLAPLRSL